MVRVKIDRDAIDNLQKAKDLLDKQSELAKKLDTPPPSGLIPIGDSGLYRTPEVIDPRDCEHYPDSPWCGGNPITRDAIGLDFDYGADGCSIHASVTPKLGYVKLPTHTIAYIKEECRKNYQEIEKEPKLPPVEVPEEWKNEQPDRLPPGFKADDVVCAATITTYIEKERVYDDAINDWKVVTTVIEGKVDEVNYPSFKIAQSPQGFNYAPKTAICDLLGSVTVSNSEGISNTFTRDVRMHPQLPKQGQNGGWFEGNWGALGGVGDYQGMGFNTYGSPVPLAFCLYYGRYGDIFPSQELPLGVATGALIVYPDGSTQIVENGRITFFKISLAFIKKLDTIDKSKIPKDRRKRDCCMQCCGSQTGQGTQRQQQDLEEIKKMLRQILKNQGTYPFSVTLYDTDDNKPEAQTKNVSVADQAKAQKLIVEREEKNAKSIGIDQFPIYVPSSIVEDRSNGLLGDIGNVKNKIFKQRIESIAELLTWKIGNDREIFGAWQEYIDIQDSDPEKKGNQPKRVVLPNMARSFRELVLLNSVQIKTTGLLLDAVLKMYIDIANTKVSSAVTEAIVRDIQGFLDYPTDEKPLNVPLGIKIPSDNDSPDDKEDIQRFLSNSTVKANFDDWTGEGSLHDLMVTLLDAAAMIRAAFFQKG